MVIPQRLKIKPAKLLKNYEDVVAKTDTCTHINTKNIQSYTQAHLLNQLVTLSPNVPVVSFWRRNTSSLIHNLQSAPKITGTQSGFPEWGKQQNIAHGICPIVRSQRQSVNGIFPSYSKHRELDNTATRNRPHEVLCHCPTLDYTETQTWLFISSKKINHTEREKIVFSV